MSRTIIAAAICGIFICAGSANADDDPVATKLNVAKAAYDKALKDYKDEIEKWFEKEDEDARKLKTAVTENVKKVAAEKKEFDDKGVLPARAPLALKTNRIKNANEVMIKAYIAASDEYLRLKKDDEAGAIDKELEAFNGAIADERLPRKPTASEIEKFAGRWKIVAENGQTASYFTLTKSFEAKKSHAPNATGKWEVVGDEVRITWSDGWKDVLRPKIGGVLKIAFAPMTSWNDTPANTQKAIKEK